MKRRFNEREEPYTYDKFLWLLSSLKNLHFYINKLKELPDDPVQINIKQTKKEYSSLNINSVMELKAISKFKASGKVPSHFVQLEGDIELLAGYNKDTQNKKHNEKENTQDLSFNKMIKKSEKLDDLILSISDSFSLF
ncbi:hypothetical protein [Psychroflexus tropicus]|uniref:hypothetical protein n=1 Tax=Psychroflexus tropicus TaxID=197345 RepID=UPI0012F8E41C|nr:hypothetical protein [Psychroflexus tropicus]